MRRRLPPATPDAPHALMAETMQRSRAVPKSTVIPREFVAASVSTEIVTDAPAMFMVDPSGIEMEYVSSSRPSLSQRAMFTGIFAAELLVKKAVMKLSTSIQKWTRLLSA